MPKKNHYPDTVPFLPPLRLVLSVLVSCVGNLKVFGDFPRCRLIYQPSGTLRRVNRPPFLTISSITVCHINLVLHT